MLQRVSIGIIGVFIFFGGCKSYEEQRNELPDTPDRGAVRVSADETFKPIVDELVQVYESNHPGTSIQVEYKTEADCLRDLLNDSIRMVLVTRRPSAEERKLMADSLRVNARSLVVARDGIAVIVHPASADTVFTLQEISDILKGKHNKKLIPVFDGVKATSTVRFIVDSVLKGETLTSQALAARSSEGVIDYVAAHPGTVGFVGVGWVGNPEDSAQLSFLKKINVAHLESTDRKGYYVKAYQANLYVGRYPMVRDLVYILKERHRGLATGFAHFVSGEIGQIIFRRGYLAPAQKRLGVRPVRVNE
ncbi:MAG: PstS family phosphate ABC transporter substrate-binding protein [Sphingomonadales bacterium]|nr:phosphate ABC transporter substrate-binding protein, PhoT family [Sphingomonadales bacterium]